MLGGNLLRVYGESWSAVSQCTTTGGELGRSRLTIQAPPVQPTGIVTCNSLDHWCHDYGGLTLRSTKKKPMSRYLKTVFALSGLSLVLLSGSPALAEEYGYPIDDAFVATVVTTPADLRAELPRIPLKRRAIEIFEGREPPEIFFYDKKLRYSYAKQKGPAPLIFLIAGTGSSYISKSVQLMAKAFYEGGFHIVTISSPTHPNFVVAASETGVPGHAMGDARDLLRVMQKIREHIGDRIEVTDYYVSGYSLGGFNAAFVTYLDETEKVFNFKRALADQSAGTAIQLSVATRSDAGEHPRGRRQFQRLFRPPDQGLYRSLQAFRRPPDGRGFPVQGVPGLPAFR